MPDSSDNDQLQKQYQDILDQYASALDQSPPPPPPPPPEVPPLQSVPPTPVIETSPPSPAIAPAAAGPTPPKPVAPPPPPPPPSEPILPPPPPEIVSSTPPSPPSSPVFIKILFYFSLLIFLAVVFAVVKSFSKNQQPSSNSSPTSVPTETQSAVVCQLNENTYQVNETFPAADGCNTCTCQPDQLIACTEKTCEATPSTKLTPPKAIVPTTIADSGPLKTILKTINSSLKTAYKEISSDDGKTWSVDLTKSYNKPNILIMKKAITDFGLVFQEDLSGEAGQDWKEVYVRNADTCSLQYTQSVLTLSCYN